MHDLVWLVAFFFGSGLFLFFLYILDAMQCYLPAARGIQ